MRKLLLSILILSTAGKGNLSAQVTSNADSLRMVESGVVPVYSKAYLIKYNRLKSIIVEVYPYALYAAQVLDDLEAEAEGIEKKRKKKKFYKNAYKGLKEDFKYVLLDMYTSEGKWLMKLVHRETGMTVYEIAEKYRGKKNADIFSLMGKLWSQDLKVTFDADGEDKIAEHVVSDIENGIIELDHTVEITTKEEYKEGMKEYRANQKKYKKKKRKNKRTQRKNKRKEKKEDKQDE
ncbi:MAG: DUF4294 domain-containing protein [Crocinitomicaceae bacterium]|nr:DUF4294 domain-containing protein [Crocinitomicaceae bacterium]